MRPAELLLLACLAAGPARAASAQAAAGAAVFLVTRPPAAEVAWNGTRLPGRTPLLLRGVAAGRHRVEATRAGYEPCVEEVDLADAEVRVVELFLTDRTFQVGFPSDERLVVAGEAHDARDRVLRLPQGRYGFSRVRDGLRVEPVYPRQRLIDALHLCLPIVAGFTTLLTADAIANPPHGRPSLPPTLIAAHAFSGLMLGAEVILNLERRRYMRGFAYRLDAPARDGALLAEAEECLGLGDAERTLELLGAVPADSPLYPAALYRRAAAHALGGDFGAALEGYNRITNDYPEPGVYDRAQKNAADILLRFGRFQESLSRLDAMVMLDPLYTREEIDALRAETLGRWSQQAPEVRLRAEAACRELLERYRDSSRVDRYRLSLAALLRDEGRTAEALEQVRMILAAAADSDARERAAALEEAITAGR